MHRRKETRLETCVVWESGLIIALGKSKMRCLSELRVPGNQKLKGYDQRSWSVKAMDLITIKHLEIV